MSGYYLIYGWVPQNGQSSSFSMGTYIPKLSEVLVEGNSACTKKIIDVVNGLTAGNIATVRQVPSLVANTIFPSLTK